jgi:hypothetical protein
LLTLEFSELSLKFGDEVLGSIGSLGLSLDLRLGSIGSLGLALDLRLGGVGPLGLSLDLSLGLTRVAIRQPGPVVEARQAVLL